MKKYELDYTLIANSMKKEATKIELPNKLAVDDKIKTRMIKVAFDVYNINNDITDSLWKLESSADDGKEYLVRLDAEVENTLEKSAGWSAVSNESGNSVTLSYKGVPIQRMSSKLFGFNKDDVGSFKRMILEKVASNETFKKRLINMQPKEKKAELIKTFPELITK